jgi:transposase InsO family protein
MTYSLIKDNAAEHGVGTLCEALEVSRGGYYEWLRRSPSLRASEDESIKRRVGHYHSKSRGSFGYRMIHSYLTEEGIRCGRDRTLRLMREMGVKGCQAKRFKPQGTHSDHGYGYAANLLGELDAPDRLDQVWVADTTYLKIRSGWLYLATVMDLRSRRIVGWSVSGRNDADLVCEALSNAVLTRGVIRSGIMAHSDRGSTYASFRYRRMLDSYGMLQSMSGKGNCYDNAAMESFYGRFKSAFTRGRTFSDEGELRSLVFQYIEPFYNRFRKHSSLGYKSPIQFEKEFLANPLGGCNEQATNANN